MTIILSEKDNITLKQAFESMSKITMLDIKYIVIKRVMSNYEYIYFLEEV